MFKKIISALVILLLLQNIVNINFVNAVNTNEQATPWTIEKAEHLAKKALYWATQEKVNELYNAWSANAAVNILFPSINWTDRTSYENKLSNLLNQEWLIGTSSNEMREYYTVKKLEDPYEAKSKLFTIFEDTFSVDTIWWRINYWDIEETHDLIYSHTLWNYKEMVKSILYNDWNKWDYALWEYLDLFNQTNPKYPNENYAREIIQLFLMLEYIPTESEDNWWIRNYSEDDVNALAKILYWFESNANTHRINYNNTNNTNISVSFLDWNLKNWDDFHFYNSWSWIIDIQLLKQSISGNNWLPDNTIDYIFSKRENQIAMFLADKFYRFYIAENPSRLDLNTIANKIIENNFEIYPTIKWLLANDIMYSDKSMNSVIYKNPLELVIWTAKILWLTNEKIDLKYNLNNLWWVPYSPKKIFWRDWFDDNAVFFSPYISNKWTSESSKFVTKMIQTNSWFISQESTPELLVQYLEDKLFLWKRLDSTTKEKIIFFLTHDKDWNEIQIDYTNQNYINNNIHWAIYIMLNMPEYVLQSWYDKTENLDSQNQNFFSNDNKVVFIKASWWLDWLHAVIQKDEYQEYLDLRWEWALTWSLVENLDDKYYINSAFAPFKDLYDSWNLRVINRVGTPDHSRWHDSASRKITSLNNLYSEEDEWIFWHFIQNEDVSKTIVLDWWTSPSIFRNWNYMWIWASALFTVDLWDTNNKNYKINTLKDILENRNYNWIFWEVFKNSSKIDSVAKESKANWWREWSWYNMQQKFTFLESLYNAWLWNAAWLRADWWYDTHRDQKDYLTNNFTTVAKETADFFNSVKDKENITIVIYSEFWRTNKLNSSLWVDHWMWGWMFILSNNSNLLNNNFKQKTYWNMSIKNSSDNWLWVWVDYRAVYSWIYKSLYWIDTTNDFWWKFDIESYDDKRGSDIELFNINYKNYYTTRNNVEISFDINDTNFHPKEASYVKFEYWINKDSMYEFTNYYINRYMKINDNNIKLSLTNTLAWEKYFYKITLYDNQYNEKIIEWSFISPEISSNKKINNNKITRLSQYNNLNINWIYDLTDNTSSWIILSETWSTEFYNNSELKLITSSWTNIISLETNENINWNWTFSLPELIDKNIFIKNDIIYENKNLLNSKIIKLLKVWSDSLWVKMNLNKKVDIEINNIDTSKYYKVIYSNDWINWNKVDDSDLIKDENKIIIKTNHFTIFAILETDINWKILNQWEEANNNSNDTENISSSNSSSWSTPRLIKDYCPYWDYSISYYDKKCWEDPYLYDLNYENNEILNNDLINLDLKKSYTQLLIKEKEKAKIFNELFIKEQSIDDTEINDLIKNETSDILNQDIIETLTEKYDSEKSVLILLREKMSSVLIWEYKLIHIKNSTLNKNFEKIWNIILKRNYSKEKTSKLFEILNNIIIYSAINKLENIEIEIKAKNKVLLKKEIEIFIKELKIKRTISNKNSDNKIVENKVEIKKESISDKINRINEVKKLNKNKETITEKINRINLKNKAIEN